jgi:hypothetical protein
MKTAVKPPAKAPAKTASAKPKAARSGLSPGFSPVSRGAAPAGQRQAPASLAPAPSRRGKITPLTPMRVQAAKSMSRLADHVQQDHPDLLVHQHLRDAARTLRQGNEEASQRHLRAALFSLTPQSLMRNGKHTDDDHMAARAAMHDTHRHLLLVKDISDVAAKNQASLRRDSYDDDSGPMPQPPAHDPNAGYGPGALAQKPTARQPGGDRALNAPDRSSSGGSDPAVADPVGAQPRGSRQFARSWDELGAVIDLASRPWLPAKEYWAGVDAGTAPKAKFAKTSRADLVAHTDGTVTSKKTKAVIGRGLAHADGRWVATHADGTVSKHGSKQAALAVIAARHNKTEAAPAVKAPQQAPAAAKAPAVPERDEKGAPGKAVSVAPPAKATAVKAPAAKAQAPKAVPAQTAPEKPGGDPAKTLDAAIKSGVASRSAPGSKKVALSQGKEGSTRVVTFGNGSQYIQKDFKGMADNRPPIMGGTGGPMPPEQQRRQVAKEILASKISKVIGAGAPDIIGDPGSPSGLYEPKVAGVSAVEHFKAGKKGMGEMFRSPEGAKIGLMDAITGNEDRHMGNVMVSPAGKPIPIDHNDTWGMPDARGGLFTDSPFAAALDKQIDAGKSPFTVAELDRVKTQIQALKAEFEAMPGGGGARNFQMTMDKLAQIRERVAGQ